MRVHPTCCTGSRFSLRYENSKTHSVTMFTFLLILTISFQNETRRIKTVYVDAIETFHLVPGWISCKHPPPPSRYGPNFFYLTRVTVETRLTIWTPQPPTSTLVNTTTTFAQHRQTLTPSLPYSENLISVVNTLVKCLWPVCGRIEGHFGKVA